MQARVRSLVVGTTCALAIGGVGVTAPPATAGPSVAQVQVAAYGPPTKAAADTTTARGRRAVRWAQRVTHFPTRTCMVFVRTALRVGPRYGTPRVAWTNAHYRHHSPLGDIPAGVPVYTAGHTAPGHIVLSLGNGKVRTTDWPRPGRVGTVKLRKLLRSWGHTYLGWSEDLNGTRVWHR